MPYNTKSLLRDSNNQLIPQYFNDTTDSYEPAKGANGAINVSLATALSADFHSVSIKQLKGPITTVHNAITATATSAEIDCRGYNAVLLHVVVSGTGAWTISLQGATVSGGTFVDCYTSADTKMEKTGVNASRTILFVGIPDFVKVVATETTDGSTLTVKAQPLNM